MNLAELPELIVGADYYMRCVIPGVWNVPREMVERYIALEHIPPSGPELVMSLRQADPPSGTQHVKIRHIVEIRLASECPWLPQPARQFPPRKVPEARRG